MFLNEVARPSKPYFLAKAMHARDAHATFLPFLHPDFFSVSVSVFSVSSVAPPGHLMNKSRYRLNHSRGRQPRGFRPRLSLQNAKLNFAIIHAG